MGCVVADLASQDSGSAASAAFVLFSLSGLVEVTGGGGPMGEVSVQSH